MKDQQKELMAPRSDVEGDREKSLALDPLASALAVAGVADNGFWSSFTAETEEQAAVLHKAVTMASVAVADAIGREFDVCNVVLHKVEIEDEQTKEIKTLTRMVLVAPDGATIATCSTGALNSFLALCRICGAPPWNPAKTLRIHQVNTRRKRRTFGFEYLPPALQQQQTGKPKK